MSGIFHMMFNKIAAAIQQAFAVDLDGASDYFSRTSDFTGNADGKTFTFSAWVWVTDTGTNKRIYVAGDDGASNSSYFEFNSSEQFRMQLRDSGLTVRLNATLGLQPGWNNTWVHVLASINLANSAQRFVFINDVDFTSSVTWTTYSDANIDWTQANHRVGSADSSSYWKGRLSNVFLDYTYRDLSVEANRRLFITADRKPATINTTSSNLLTYSEQLNNVIWNKADVTITTDATISPDGTTTADSLIESATTANHRINQSVSVINGTSYTFSVYAKKNTRQVIKLELSNGGWSSAPRVTFNLNSGTVQSTAGSPVSYSITSVGSGWYRCTVTAAATSTTTGAAWLMLGNSDTGEASSYAGDGLSGIYIWGAQFEAGSTATTYVQTVGYPVYTPVIYMPMDDPSTAHINLGTGGNFTLNGTIARSGRGPNQFNVPYSDLDGSADYLSRTSITGIADGKQFTFMCCFNSDSLASSQAFFRLGTNPVVTVLVQASGRLDIYGDPVVGGSAILDGTSASGTIIAGRNYVLTVSVDLADTAKRFVYLNGSALSISWNAYTNDDLDLTHASNFVASGNGDSKLNGRLGNVFFHTSYIDLSVPTNLAKFVTGTGIDAKPVDLGAQGELPFGTPPIFCLPMYGNDAGRDISGNGNHFTVNSGPYPGARGPNEYWGNKATFNGTTGYEYRTSALTGVSDGKTISLSFWFSPSNSAVSAILFCLQTATPATRLLLFRDGSNNLRIYARNSAGTMVLDASITSAAFTSGSLNFVQMCFDLANASNRRFYVNGVEQGGTYATYSNDTMNLTAPHLGIGTYSSLSTSDFFAGGMAEFYFTTDYIDFSQEANRLKFRDCFGSPTDLPAKIAALEVPNPAIYMRFDPADQGRNDGTGGNFTKSGTIADGGQL